MSKRVVSIIIPVFNEEKNIPLIYSRLLKILNSLRKKYSYEIIFIDDGSLDRSSEIIEGLIAKNRKIKYVQFSRNFGKEISLSAGLDVARGDAVIMIDADLQHPINLIPGFIKKWEKGGEVVIGVRERNKGEGFVKRLGSYMFYKIMNSIGDTKITPNATDYRLLDKKVVLAFRRFTEHDRMTRGLIAWLGFKREFIYFKANKRNRGKAGYNKLKLFKLALSSIVSHSLFPLKLAGYLGLFISIVFGIIGLLLFLGIHVFHNKFALSISGTALLGFLLVFLIGITLSCFGLIALYIANIQTEVLKRPTYVVRKSSFTTKI